MIHSVAMDSRNYCFNSRFRRLNAFSLVLHFRHDFVWQKYMNTYRIGFESPTHKLYKTYSSDKPSQDNYEILRSAMRFMYFHVSYVKKCLFRDFQRSPENRRQINCKYSIVRNWNFLKIFMPMDREYSKYCLSMQ